MAIVLWDASFELTPAGTDAKSQGDDRIRELKENTSTRLLQGGHVWKNALTTKDGLHAVNGGGAGVSPDIYKSDFASKLVAYTDVLERFYENGQFDKDLLVTGNTTLTGTLDVTGGTTIRNYLHSARTLVTGPATYAVLETETHIVANDTAGAITLNLPTPAVATGIRHLVITKVGTAQTVTISSANLVNAPNLSAAGNYIIGYSQRGSVYLLYDYALQKWYCTGANLTAQRRSVGDASYIAVPSDDFITCAPTIATTRTVTLPDTAYLRNDPITVVNSGTAATSLVTLAVPAGHYLNNVLNGTMTIYTWQAVFGTGAGTDRHGPSVTAINVDATHWFVVGSMLTRV